jgi:hypothetical protein
MASKKSISLIYADKRYPWQKEHFKENLKPVLYIFIQTKNTPIISVKNT